MFFGVDAPNATATAHRYAPTCLPASYVDDRAIIPDRATGDDCCDVLAVAPQFEQRCGFGTRAKLEHALFAFLGHDGQNRIQIPVSYCSLIGLIRLYGVRCFPQSREDRVRYGVANIGGHR